jgi:hypothetical protein
VTLAAFVAPTTIISIVSGQTGLLAAALLAGGIRLADRCPILGGILLGLLSYKPQIGLLVPIALVSARLWRCIATACATLFVLVIVTSAAFGPDIWVTWISAIPVFWREVAAGGGRYLHLMPTVRSTLLQIGAAPTLVWVAQSATAIAVSCIAWVSFRSGSTPLAGAALMVATFLATPYAFVYDMPVVATAVLWVIIERHRSGGSFGLGELLVLTLAAIAPMTMPAEAARPPIGMISLLLLLGLILRRRWALRAERAADLPAQAADG